MINISGKIIHVYPVKSGIGKTGKWMKEQIIIKLDQSKYQNKVGIWLWNFNIGKFKVGDVINANVSLEGFEIEGKYITTITAYKICKMNGFDSLQENNHNL